jgi:exonuclease III
VKQIRLHLGQLFIICVILIAGCGEHRITSTESLPPGYVQPQGREETLELATWNLEYFPQTSSTVEEVAKIIDALDIDLYAIQEINDTTAFLDLLNRLPEYDGLYSWDWYSWGYLKTGIIYKRSIISVGQPRLIFQDDWYAFTRPPLEIPVVAQNAGNRFDFVLIVLHLKAGSETDDFLRRQQANEKMKTYLDEMTSGGGEKDYIVAGDWNDELDDPPVENAFAAFLDDPNDYRFLTSDLIGRYDDASYPRYGSLIDHILITSDVLSEYDGGYVKTLRLEEEVEGYSVEISDHRPVMAVFPVFGG